MKNDTNRGDYGFIRTIFNGIVGDCNWQGLVILAIQDVVKMVKIHESKTGQKTITLRSGLCEAMDLHAGDEVSISFRADLGLWVFHKVLESTTKTKYKPIKKVNA